MNCPVCADHPILSSGMLDSLPVHRCRICGGHWLRAEDYSAWRDQHAGSVGEGTALSEPDSHDTPGMLKCPEDGYFMARYRVGHGKPFTVDKCRNCGGAWLDGGEWEALRERGLDDDLPLIMDEAWQKDLRRAERQQAEDDRLRARLGDADYERIREVRAWLAGHTEWPTLVGYLGLQGRPRPLE